jgi:AraC family transcriptional regulator, regulatory protein of adaptative response / methylated-DNA-[protein]-cysteine methyltransferase
MKMSVFFDTWAQAEQAGFRPCKRCNPRSSIKPDKHTVTIVKACRIMDQAEEQIPLKDLAARLGLSTFYFQRLFKRVMGITPKQYAMQKRFKQVQTRLKQDASVADAVYEAGFSSSSRFYEGVAGKLGMKPSEYRKDLNLFLYQNRDLIDPAVTPVISVILSELRDKIKGKTDDQQRYLAPYPLYL